MVKQHYRWDFIGLSTDTKPIPTDSENVVDGSTYFCSDTSKLYVFCKDQWYERKALGNGGGGSYTQGDGITISGNEISVNNTIQRKLTAGTNIKNINGSSVLGSGNLSLGLNSILGASGAATNRTATFTNTADSETGEYPDVISLKSSDNKHNNIINPAKFDITFKDITTNPQDPTDVREIGHHYYLLDGDLYIDKKQMTFGEYIEHTGIFSADHVNVSSYDLTNPESPNPLNSFSMDWGSTADVSMSDNLRDAWINALKIDSGWVTLNTGLSYRKLNGVVYININKTGLSLSTTASTLGTLPDGFRPSNAVNFPAFGTSQMINVNISTAGDITAKTLTSTDTTCSSTLIFPLG